MGEQNDFLQRQAMLEQLRRIADALDILAAPGRDRAPELVRPITEYWGFDWSAIKATVIKADSDGPTHVEWGGKIYTRRAPRNKFEPAIWYSRSTGRDEESDTTNYARLITFREIKDADPVDSKALALTHRPEKAPAAQPAPAAQQAAAPKLQEQPPAAKPQPTPAPQPAATQTAAPKSPAPAAKEPLPPVSLNGYLTLARSKPITEEAARWIAKHVGITDPAADYSEAAVLLDYFYEARHAGLKLGEAWNHLVAYECDLQDATNALPK